MLSFLLGAGSAAISESEARQIAGMKAASWPLDTWPLPQPTEQLVDSFACSRNHISPNYQIGYQKIAVLTAGAASHVRVARCCIN